MKENFESQFGDIDSLLDDIDQSTSDKQLLAEIDDLCNEIEDGLDARKNEIAAWPETQKRAEAMNSEDPFVLNLLSIDENFNIRTLSACNPKTPENSLRRLIEGASDYILMVIAHNPNATTEVLDRITQLSGEKEVLDTVKQHPNVSMITEYKLENQIT